MTYRSSPHTWPFPKQRKKADMSIKDKLIEARALIEKPENWTQGAFARDEKGEAVEIGSDKAVSYCMIGALWRACNAGEDRTKARPAQDVLHKAAEQVTGDSSILLVNDFGTHEEVIRVFDAAIERAS